MFGLQLSVAALWKLFVREILGRIAGGIQQNQRFSKKGKDLCLISESPQFCQGLLTQWSRLHKASKMLNKNCWPMTCEHTERQKERRFNQCRHSIKYSIKQCKTSIKEKCNIKLRKVFRSEISSYAISTTAWRAWRGKFIYFSYYDAAFRSTDSFGFGRLINMISLTGANCELIYW